MSLLDKQSCELFVETDIAWHRYNRIVANSTFAAPTVAFVVIVALGDITALSDNPLYDNLLVIKKTHPVLYKRGTLCLLT